MQLLISDIAAGYILVDIFFITSAATSRRSTLQEIGRFVDGDSFLASFLRSDQLAIHTIAAKQIRTFHSDCASDELQFHVIKKTSDLGLQEACAQQSCSVQQLLLAIVSGNIVASCMAAFTVSAPSCFTFEQQ